jgi:hypothetical protein
VNQEVLELSLQVGVIAAGVPRAVAVEAVVAVKVNVFNDQFGLSHYNTDVFIRLMVDLLLRQGVLVETAQASGDLEHLSCKL